MQDVISLVLQEEVLYFLSDEIKWVIFLRVQIGAEFALDRRRQVGPIIGGIDNAVH